MNDDEDPSIPMIATLADTIASLYIDLDNEQLQASLRERLEWSLDDEDLAMAIESALRQIKELNK